MKLENFEKYDMLECYIETNKNSADASDLYFNRYPDRRQPNSRIYSRLQENLINYGSFDKPRRKVYFKEDEEDVVNVLGSVVANPKISSRQIEVEVGVSRNRALKILKRNKYKAYKIRKVHHLNANDYNRRLEFCRWYLAKQEHDEFFFRNVIWTDEVHISSAGIFNRNNAHWWSDTNVHQVVNHQIQQGRYGFNVWCAIMNNRILAYCIYRENLNGERYLRILQDNLENVIDNMPLEQIRTLFFQHDGAPAHNAQIVTIFLNNNFGNSWLGTNGPVKWPPRSPDLSPLDFFLWGYVKDRLYKIPHQNIQELIHNFEECINGVSNIHIYNAVRSVGRRCQLCLDNNGRQFEHLL